MQAVAVMLIYVITFLLLLVGIFAAPMPLNAGLKQNVL